MQLALRMLHVGQVAKQSVKEALDDDIAGVAARVAYYFFLSFFPLILALFAFAGIFGHEEWFQGIADWMRDEAPEETAQILTQLVSQIAEQEQPGLLSVGLLLTLWAGSNMFAGLTAGLNRMYNVEENRSFWKKRLLAVVAFVICLVLIFPAAVVLLAGPELVGIAGVPEWWNLVRWPLVFLVLVGVLWIIYYMLPARDQRGHGREVLIGAVVGTVVWLIATVLFRVYVANFGSYGETYGVLGGIIILLLWLYVTAIAILFGGETAAVLEERARPQVEVGGVREGSEEFI